MDLSKPYARLALLFVVVLFALFLAGFHEGILAVLVVTWVLYSIDYMESLEGREPERPEGSDGERPV